MSATEKSPPPSDGPRKWRLAAAITAGVALFGIVWFWNQASDTVREEHNYKCLLTGCDRTLMIVNGITVSDTVSGNEVSDWSDINGVPGLTPGQLGWELASTVTTTGSEAPRFGEGPVYLIPYQIFQGSVSVTSTSREEVLRSYQQHLLSDESFTRRSPHQAMQAWLDMQQNRDNAPRGSGF